MLISPINPSDIQRIKGEYPHLAENKDFVTVSDLNDQETHIKSGVIVGFEGVGKVKQIGNFASSAINGNIEIGDWVIPMSTDSYGTWSTHIIADPKNLVLIKDKTSITPEHLCSLKINAATAYRMLKDIVSLNEGDYIIQNGANSGAGKYLIQLARQWGYRTINVIRDREGSDLVARDLYELGADIVFKDSEIESPKIKSLMSSLNNPIRMIISCVSGKYGTQLINYLPDGGVHVSYGDMTHDTLNIKPLEMVFRGITFVGYWLMKFYGENPPSVWLETWNDIIDMMRLGKLKMQPVEKIPWYSISDNVEHLNSAEKIQNDVNNAITSSNKSAFSFTSKF
ncbi:hypothetical protein BB561_006711 [Smittium simulii]|uniref:Uncharacterized protein n=1 Tax=Smittium simulii TaxID=133385 RepID=A0A2T9Y260_9FUNG|nr:hypothetical protein BB561_006711 [Smittium simulii]